MYSDLYRYLLRYNELPVPGVGTFTVERRPAILDFPSKQIYGPVYSIHFNPDSYLPGKHFFNWLSHVRNITDREAVFHFNDFAFDMKRDLEEGKRIVWNGVGEIKKEINGDITLLPSDVLMEEPLVAEKIIRTGVSHKVRVGEEEKSSSQMSELLAKDEGRKVYWWILPVTIGILALMFIGWYLSENGLEIFSVSNNAKLVPDETPSINYKILQ
jgi:hypothetical protein